MATPPVPSPDTASRIPRSLRFTGDALITTVDLRKGQRVTQPIDLDAPYSAGSPIPTGTMIVATATGGAALASDPVLAHLVDGGHAVHPSHANCTITNAGAVVTAPIPSKSPLILGLCESSVLTQDLPVIIKAASEELCDGFLASDVPVDSHAQAGHPAGIDGYITPCSAAALACYASWCDNTSVIGCGYGELVALFAHSRRAPCIGFEMFDERRAAARALTTRTGVFSLTPLFGTLRSYESTWPDGPTMMWTNNYRFNDDPDSNIPRDILALPHFPLDTSVLVCMVPFSGEIDIPVCHCGSCYDGFCDHDGVDGSFIVRRVPNVHIDTERCGLRRGFATGGRLLIRTQTPGPTVEPFGAGSGRREARVYQMFTCTESPPTPHTGLVYDKIVITSPADLTDSLRAELEFVSESDIVGGPVTEYSMIFHGIDGEEYGIDAAVLFTATEPGSRPFVYAYRTLARVRDCGLRETVRINHDVVKPAMQGRSFINQANLLTAQVLRAQFPEATTLVIEPDREIGYHRNYRAHGFLWRLRESLECSDTPPPGISQGAVRSYRAQIDLPEERYPSVWINLPVPASDYSNMSDRRKRPRHGGAPAAPAAPCRA